MTPSSNPPASKVKRIAPDSQPVFPCWLWDKLTHFWWRAEAYPDSDGHGAIARIYQAEGMSGCGIQIRLVNCGAKEGSFWLAQHWNESDTNYYILFLPSPRREQDARDAGWKLLKKFSTQGHISS